MHERVAVATGHHRQAAAQLVGAVPAQLALVLFLQLLAAAAALAHGSHACLQRGGLRGLAFGQWRCGRLDEAVQLGAQRHHRGTRAVEAGGDGREGDASLDEAGVDGQHPSIGHLGERRSGDQESPRPRLGRSIHCSTSPTSVTIGL